MYDRVRGHDMELRETLEERIFTMDVLDVSSIPFSKGQTCHQILNKLVSKWKRKYWKVVIFHQQTRRFHILFGL